MDVFNSWGFLSVARLSSSARRNFPSTLSNNGNLFRQKTLAELSSSKLYRKLAFPRKPS